MGGEGGLCEAAELTAWLSLSGLSVAAEDSDFLYLSAVQGVSKSREQLLFLKIEKKPGWYTKTTGLTSQNRC